MKTPWRILTAALLLSLAQQNSQAAEIKVLSIPGLKGAFDALIPRFERSAGHQVTIRYEIFAGQKAEIEKGEFDVAFFARPVIDELGKQGKVVPTSVVEIARTSIGVAVKRGAPKPDISNEEAFKRTLLAAKSIAYTRESATGVHITRLLDRLGLTAALKDKLKLQPGGGMTTPAVAKGDAEMAIVLVSDILATPGVDLVGPLPQAYQNQVTQTAAIGAKAKQAAPAAALIQHLANPSAGSVYKSNGLDPVH